MRPSAGGAPGPADPSGQGSPVREGRSAVPRQGGESPGNAQRAWRSPAADSYRGARVGPRKTLSATTGRSPSTRFCRYLRLSAVAGASAVTGRRSVHARLRRTFPPRSCLWSWAQARPGAPAGNRGSAIGQSTGNRSNRPPGDRKVFFSLLDGELAHASKKGRASRSGETTTRDAGGEKILRPTRSLLRNPCRFPRWNR